MSPPVLHVALIHPEIGPNAGNIGRLCLGVGAALHLVHPLGFSTDEKQVRRAGLDYWKHVDVTEHADLDAFLAWAAGRRLHLLSARASLPYTRIDYQAGDVLVFGRESSGLPEALVETYGAWKIPLTGPIRSFNVANSVAIVVMQALQKIQPALF